MKGKMAIIGDGDSVLAFKAVGIDAYGVENAAEAEDLIKKLSKTHRIIFVTDALAKDIDEVISKYNAAAYPIILPVPSKTGGNGYGIERLKKQTERALGVDILFKDEK